MHDARDTGRTRASPTTPDPSRRRLFATAASVLVAGTALATTAPSLSTTAIPADDPVLPLFRRWRALEDESQAAEQCWDAWRQAHPGPEISDPEGLRLFRETDRLTNASTDVLEEILLTPATTPAGALEKLKAAAGVWPLTRPAEEFEFHEDMARDAILDAVRLLAGSAAA
jgi:hypothetical protein